MSLSSALLALILLLPVAAIIPALVRRWRRIERLLNEWEGTR